MVYKVNRLMQETCPIVALQLFFFTVAPEQFLGHTRISKLYVHVALLLLCEQLCKNQNIRYVI